MNGMTLSSFTAINSTNVCLNNYGCSAIKMFTIARNVNSNREWQPSGNLTLKNSFVRDEGSEKNWRTFRFKLM